MASLKVQIKMIASCFHLTLLVQELLLQSTGYNENGVAILLTGITKGEVVLLYRLQ